MQSTDGRPSVQQRLTKSGWAGSRTQFADGVQGFWLCGAGIPGVEPVKVELTDFKSKEVVDVLEVDAVLVATGRAPYTQARPAALPYQLHAAVRLQQCPAAEPHAPQSDLLQQIWRCIPV